MSPFQWWWCVKSYWTHIHSNWEKDHLDPYCTKTEDNFVLFTGHWLGNLKDYLFTWNTSTSFGLSILLQIMTYLYWLHSLTMSRALVKIVNIFALSAYGLQGFVSPLAEIRPLIACSNCVIRASQWETPCHTYSMRTRLFAYQP